MVNLAFTVDSLAQTDSAVITNINRIVEQINKDTGFLIRTLESVQFPKQVTDGGHELTGYFKDGELVKMVEWVGLSSCVIEKEYFLQDNKLIFVRMEGKEFLYVDSLATFNSKIQNLTLQGIFYFNEDKEIKKSIEGQTRCGGIPGSKSPLDLVAEADRYRKVLGELR